MFTYMYYVYECRYVLQYKNLETYNVYETYSMEFTLWATSTIPNMDFSSTNVTFYYYKV